MILYDTSQWPTVIIHFRPSEWRSDDFASFIAAFNLLLQRSLHEEQRIKLFIQGSKEVDAPPIRFYQWIISEILKLYTILCKTIDRTAIYTSDNRLDLFFDMLFKVYTPSRPLFRVEFYRKRFLLCIDLYRKPFL